MIKQIKTFMENMPYPVGRVLSILPFSLRLGGQYRRFHALADQSIHWSDEQKEHYAVEHVREIVKYACNKFPCYRELYRQAGVSDLEIRSIGDIRKLPVTNKNFFREHADEFSGAYHLNTGGTTGSPFFFYVDRYAWAREWAHMHRIWEMRGYHYMDLNLALRGKNIGDRNIKYNPVHNEFLVNTYRPVSAFLPELRELFRKRSIRYIHGYPSSVYNFVIELEKCCEEEEIRKFLDPMKGVFLHSEFPYPYMKEKFEFYHLPCISWYGHSEMCILAYDADFNNRYVPWPTYGYAEVEDRHLLGTSFHNTDMPLIRYDTGDLVSPLTVTPNGLCTSFSIAEGRSGDYITDRNGKNIPLTSLIFGRHHKAFDVAEHIQVHQEKDGEVEIYLVKSGPDLEHPELLFDLSEVDAAFTVKQIQTSILTKAGKLKLKV